MTYISEKRGSLLSCNEPITNDSRSVSLKPTSAIGALIYLIRASMEDIRKSKKGKNDVR